MECNAQEPLVTVYFLTYNRPKLFPEALTSIQKQTFSNFRVLVVDNGSEPPICLPAEIAGDPRFSLIRNDHNPNGQAFNFDLLRSIRTKYTAFLFDDDRWAIDKLARQVEVLENSPTTVACFTHAKLVDESGRHLAHLENNNPFATHNRSRAEWVKRFFFEGNCLCQPSALIRTDALASAIPLLPYSLLLDFNIWINLLAQGDLHIVQEPLTYYCWASDGSNESAINTSPKLNQLEYENSRIFHSLLALPRELLCAAFELPPEAADAEIREKMFSAALACGDKAHFRFAAELAEERFNRFYLQGDTPATGRWKQKYQLAASQTRDATGKGGSDAAQQISAFERSYRQRCAKRLQFPADFELIARDIAENTATACHFHCLITLPPNAENALADTIDSLAAQVFPNWHLDIFANQPAPEGLGDVPCIGWHEIGPARSAKAAIDDIVAARKLQWIIELPAGAMLDPLYLWRLHEQSRNQQTCVAQFVDDDCCDETGQRHAPRFKPGVNPEALKSSDLAGPVCIRHDAWKISGGAYPGHGSPWFNRLLRIAEHHGWSSVAHIPDVLITYFGNYPSDTQACLHYLLNDVAAGTEVIPVSGKSWCLRYPLPALPPVTVAILSRGHVDLLERCLKGLFAQTDYPDFRIRIVLSEAISDPDRDTWLATLPHAFPRPVEVSHCDAAANHATRCNLAVNTATDELVLLLREEAVPIQAGWLHDLVRTTLQPGVAASSPCQIIPRESQIWNAGYVLGLEGFAQSPYHYAAPIGSSGYLDCLRTPRDVSALPASCLLIRKSAYEQAGGMDEQALGDHFADIDLSLKLRQLGLRLLFQPLATIVCGEPSELEVRIDSATQAQTNAAATASVTTLHQRWGKTLSVDPYWNPNLSLSSVTPTPETEFIAQWQYQPTTGLPRIFARPMPAGQGDYRIGWPLRAARKAGMVAECMWFEESRRQPTLAEILLQAPTTLIIQHYIHDHQLTALHSWEQSKQRPFLVYAMDDLLTELDVTNPFRQHLPANSRARLSYALERCDRLVVTCEFLAETYRRFIPDIRIVPNRLEKDRWLHLQTLKRNDGRPRIGWAGGITHQEDLLLLKDIIEQTRHEADWVLFGMCPQELRPLIHEYHPQIPFDDYPAKLASLNLDIAVAPLADTRFNRGKSNLRLLDYGVLGIPVVATNLDPYYGSPACLVKNRVRDWVDALQARIHDADARMREGLALQRWVHQHYLLEDHLEEWLNAHLPD